jgi:deazaflavin-dependent oxidoreductase (nitroreductase family)
MRGAPERNALVIEEYRANGGELAGDFAGVAVLLLHSVDSESGEDRVHPLTYGEHDGGWVVFATRSGADTDPTWFANLVARPATRIEVGTETIPVLARVPERAERDRIWAEWKRRNPRFVEYERMTSRIIPVVLLQRADDRRALPGVAATDERTSHRRPGSARDAARSPSRGPG